MTFTEKLTNLRQDALKSLVSKIQELTKEEDYIDLENSELYMSVTNGISRRVMGITKDKYVILESMKIFVFEIHDVTFLCELTDAINAL